MNLVFDAGALLAYLFHEEGAERVDALLLDSANNCSAHSLNLCEVYYNIVRVADESQAKRALQGLSGAGLITREDMDSAICEQAGVLKANLRRISLADCFCVSLAVRLNAQVVTTDHHELDAVAATGICQVEFVR